MEETKKMTNQESIETENQNLESIEAEIEEPEIIDDESIEVDEPQEDTVPLRTHLETKKKLREVKSRLEELEAKEYSEKVRAKRESVRLKWLNKGYDDEVASMMADDIASIYEEIGAEKTARRNSVVDEEIDELSSDDFYSDIKTYSKQIKDKISQFKKVGEDLSVEDAYFMVVNPRTKLRETNLKEQQKNIINNKKQGTASKSNVPTAASKAAKNPYPLDPTDKKALAGLKLAQPEAKWDEKKYYEMYYGNK
ncbi:MAG TPA: hypothetical protein DCO78_13460 [Chitinophagaceae bacterium]|nr:hypothetical protein [Chitinophagaceae bacterium]